MITYLSTRQHGYTLERFLQWQPELSRQFRWLPYFKLPRIEAVPVGPFIFSDLERLNGFMRVVAVSLHDQVVAQMGPEACLNDPRRVLTRRPLLDRLHAEGINGFRAWSPTEPHPEIRFPVFLRLARSHLGAATPLLANHRELQQALIRVCAEGIDVHELLLVEYEDVRSRDGLYRKYSAQRIGDDIFPYHIQFAGQWHVKKTEVRTAALEEEEAEYLATNPHRDALREVFELAGIDYGRVDYGLQHGRIQVWEINTNGNLAGALADYPPRRAALHRPFTDKAAQAFRRLDAGHPRARIEVDFSASRLEPILDELGLARRPWFDGRVAVSAR